MPACRTVVAIGLGVLVTGTSAPDDDNANRITIRMPQHPLALADLADVVTPAAKIIGQVVLPMPRNLTDLLDC
jgi:hypothetical protein